MVPRPAGQFRTVRTICHSSYSVGVAAKNPGDAGGYCFDHGIPAGQGWTHLRPLRDYQGLVRFSLFVFVDHSNFCFMLELCRAISPPVCSALSEPVAADLSI